MDDAAPAAGRGATIGRVPGGYPQQAALVAQWIEHAPPKRGMQVRFLPGALPVMRAASVALPRGDRPSRVVTARHATKNILRRGSDTGCGLDRVLASAPRRLQDRVDACLSL